MAEKYVLPKTFKGQNDQASKNALTTGTKPKIRIPIPFGSPKVHLLARPPVASSSPISTLPHKSLFNSKDPRAHISKVGQGNNSRSVAADISDFKLPLDTSFDIGEAERKIKNLSNELQEVKAHVAKLKISSDQKANGSGTQKELLKILTSLPSDQLGDLLSQLFDHLDTSTTANLMGIKTEPVQYDSVAPVIKKSNNEENLPSPISKRSSWHPITSNESDESLNLLKREKQNPPPNDMDSAHENSTSNRESAQPSCNQASRNSWGDTTQDPWAKTIDSTPYADWGDNFDYAEYQAKQQQLLGNLDRSLSDWDVRSSSYHNTSSSITPDWEAEIAAYKEERKLALARIISNQGLPTSQLFKEQVVTGHGEKIGDIKGAVSPYTTDSDSRDWDAEIAAFEEEKKITIKKAHHDNHASTPVDSHALSNQGSSTSQPASDESSPAHATMEDWGVYSKRESLMKTRSGQATPSHEKYRVKNLLPTSISTGQTQDGGYNTA